MLRVAADLGGQLGSLSSVAQALSRHQQATCSLPAAAQRCAPHPPASRLKPSICPARVRAVRWQARRVQPSSPSTPPSLWRCLWEWVPLVCATSSLRCAVPPSTWEGRGTGRPLPPSLHQAHPVFKPKPKPKPNPLPVQLKQSPALQARAQAPAIIFIDELDSVGRVRCVALHCPSAAAACAVLGAPRQKALSTCQQQQ